MTAVKAARPQLTAAAAIAAMIVMLRWQGRLWTCSCGYVLLWSGNINSSDNSQQLLDPYTFTHVLHGFLFAGLLYLFLPRLHEAWRLAAVLSLETLWEVIENTNFIIQRFRSETISLGYTGDTVVNSLVDVLACGLGAWMARRLGVAKTVGITVLIELVLLVTIRDNLLLNIIMLLHPVEAIRVWQAGH